MMCSWLVAMIGIWVQITTAGTMKVSTRRRIARLAGEWTVYQKPARIALHISSPWTAARWGGRFQRYITQTAAMNDRAVSMNETPAPRSPGTIVTTTMNSAG